MKVKNMATGKVYDAHLTTEHPFSSYGLPVLVLDANNEVLENGWYEEIHSFGKVSDEMWHQDIDKYGDNVNCGWYRNVEEEKS